MKIILIIIISAALITGIVSAVVCSGSLKVEQYSLSIDNIETPVKLVCISDLHSKEFGDNNSDLLALIEQQKPDAILADGDMINRYASESDVQNFINLLENLLKIAPVFYSTGNHEVDYMETHGEDLLQQIADTGAVVLYDNYVETEIAGNTIRIGGSSGHYRSSNWTKKQDYAMQKEIGDSDLPAIVMMHMPENLVLDSARKDWNADLYVSGHTHGGVIRLPFVGGVYAPSQGFFARYDYGQYLVDDRINLIITSGLAGYEWMPRVFNRPEICVITLQAK